MAKTKEEKFLIAVYEAALLHGDPHGEVNCYTVGQSIGLHPRGIETICHQLSRANFIKKSDDDLVYVTENGLALIKLLKGE